MKMLLKHIIRSLGFEVRRFVPSSSIDAQFKELLTKKGIDLIIDIGANAGQYGSFIRSLGYEGDIISFEPLSAAYQSLLETSKHDRRWTVAPRMAIGDKVEDSIINISGNSFSSSILEILPDHTNAAPESVYTGQERIEIKTLDSLLGSIIPASGRRIFMKIDVQGYEDRVIAGATRTLAIAAGVQLELSLVPLYANQILFDQMISDLQERGFNLHAIQPGFFDPQSLRQYQLEGIFFR